MTEQKKTSKLLLKKEKIEEFIGIIHALLEEYPFEIFRIHEFLNKDEYSFKIWFKHTEVEDKT